MSTLSQAPSSCPPPSSTPLLHSTPLHHSFSPSTPYRWSPDPPSPTPSTPQHHLSGTEQQESGVRVMGEEWETTWMTRSCSTTRWICRSPASHDCWWGKMDVSRFPLDRKSKKCQRSHSEWIVLNLSGNIIFPPLRPKISFFSLSLFWQMWWNDWKWTFVWLRLTH